MKRIYHFLSSSWLMAILLIIFGISIAAATFIERDYGTDAARKLVYNAKWFEFLLLIGVLNMILVTVSRKMYSRSKLTQLIFHYAFIIVIAGAGITRYFGSEGMIHLREGESSGTWYTTKNYLSIRLNNNGTQKVIPVSFSTVTPNRWKRSFDLGGHQIKVEVMDYIGNAGKTIRFDSEGGPLANLVTATPMGRENIVLARGNTYVNDQLALKFLDEGVDPDPGDMHIQLFIRDGVLFFQSPKEVTRVSMANQNTELLPTGINPFIPASIHYFDSIPVVLSQFMPMGVIDVIPADDRNSNAPPAVKLRITVDGISKSTVAFGVPSGFIDRTPDNRTSEVTINNLKFGISYGPVRKLLPFELHLSDFIIKRYPGSESPSWFESRVRLIDPSENINEEKRVYMNNILKHRGYRFYQSSYDSDEKGSILSINRDGPGTLVTYFGYILLGLGMFLSLFNSNSRFASLIRTDRMNSVMKSVIIILLIVFPGAIHANDGIQAGSLGSLPVTDKEFAARFGMLLVQDNGGRIEPMNTLSSEVLRKLTRKEVYREQSPDQVLLGMWAFPEAWQHEKMIRIGHAGIRELLKTGKHASFVDFFGRDKSSGYILHDYVENAYRKKPALRSKFDNEIIRVDERLNIAYYIYTGNIFRIFPDPQDTTHKWHSPVASAQVFSGKDSVFTSHVLTFLAEEISSSVRSGNYDVPEEILNALRVFQENYGKEVIPGERKIKAEIFYNKTKLFVYMMRLYLLVCFGLLLILFIHIFMPRFNIRWVSYPAAGIIFLVFLLHTFYLALRWYVAGHAPWSNGFEALTFIAWATILAGLIFSIRSSITIGVTAVLSGLTLMTAHLSWMDPQITNLVPVLQSYWLIIHVAVITSSYAFLGLGAMLALVNLLLMFFQSARNYDRVGYQISKLTTITEMTLIAGLYLLTIGTFLGGVWANESWGRYWAWDPKETWALVTIIVYAVILHLRLVPGLEGKVLFNILSLLGFASVIMTYFGVNYYLSGLHSYAKGDPLPVPPVVYYTVISVLIVCSLAIFNQRSLRKTMKQV